MASFSDSNTSNYFSSEASIDDSSTRKRGKKCSMRNFSSKPDGSRHFNIQEHRNETFQNLEMLKRNHLLSDVLLEVGPEVFRAHRVILAASSSYFKAMFTSGLKECESQSVKLHGVCPPIMTKLLCFMYSGEITIDEVSVCPLLSAATMFQMSHVIEACCTFLEHQLDSCNAIGIANFAQQHGCMNLYGKANLFLVQHFPDVSQQEEFLQLTECQLINLIQRDELNVTDEKDVYNAVLRWVKYDESKRQPKMESILQAVRCQYLSPRFLSTQLNKCELLQKVPACKEYLARVFQEMSLHKRPVQKARQPKPCVVYIVGGYSNNHSLDTLEAYDIDLNKWTQLSRLPVARSGLAAVYLDGIFYAIGGRSIHTNGTYHDCNWVDSYNPSLNLWQQCAPMHFPRNRLGIAMLDKLLYAIGGANGSRCYNSVEKYDPEENRWTIVHNMSQARVGVGVAVVNRLLYAIGGFDGDQRLSSIECYYPEVDQWSFVSNMQVARSGAGICSIDHSIYVIGGYDGSNQLKSVEKYDTITDTWSYAPPILTARSAMTVSVWDSKIFVMGGYDGNSFLSSVEVFDLKKSEWTAGQSLPCGRSGHASASSCHSCNES